MDPHGSLRSCALFGALNDAELKAVANLAVRKSYSSATKLFSVGDPADAFYLVVQGKVKILVPASDGYEPKQIVLRPPNFFGEIALVRDCNRTADAFAEPGSVLLRFGKDVFDGLMSADAQVARKVTEAILDRLGEFRSSQPDARAEVKEPKVLLFLSPLEGAGSSFLAANMAVKLQQLSKKKVLAVDLHLGNQGMWRHLETLSALGSYAEIFTCPEITPEIVERSASALPIGVHLLSGIDGENSDALRARHASEILLKGRQAFEFVLADVGTLRSDVTLEAARQSDVIHIVCEATEASLAEGDRMADWFRASGMGDRLRFILNKVPETPEVDPARLEEVLGDAFLGSIHRSPIPRKDKGHAGSPVVLSHPNSKISAELSGLCTNIISQPTGALDKIKDMFRWTIGLD